MKETTSQAIEKELARFETEFLNKWFPPEVDALMPDGDSRGMRERVRDFLRQSLTHIAEVAKREERERLMKVAQEYKNKGFELETFIYSGFLPEHLAMGTYHPTKEDLGEINH